MSVMHPCSNNSARTGVEMKGYRTEQFLQIVEIKVKVLFLILDLDECFKGKYKFKILYFQFSSIFSDVHGQFLLLQMKIFQMLQDNVCLRVTWAFYKDIWNLQRMLIIQKWQSGRQSAAALYPSCKSASASCSFYATFRHFLTFL